MKVFVLLLLLPFAGLGMDRFAALSMIESGDNDRAVGQAGEISRFQIRKSEWQNVTNSSQYSDFETAKRVAEQIMERRVRTFEAVFGRSPSDFDFYALWNAPQQVLENRVSRRVAERSQRFANLCERGRQLARLNAPTKTSDRPVF